MIARLSRNPILALVAIALCGSISLAQQPPAAPAPPDSSAPAAAPIERQPPSDPMRPGMRPDMQGNMRPGMMHGDMRPAMQQRMPREQMMHDRGGFHIGPQGMWWKNPTIVQRLALTPAQTGKMDGIFQQSRIQLIDLKANVEKQQVMLEPMLSANPLDTAKAMAQIDKVAQARADLEKANAKMLLGIRATLTPDQWTKLNDHQFGGPGGPEGPGGPMGAGTPGGPGGGPGPRIRGMRGGGPPPNTNNLTEPIDQQ